MSSTTITRGNSHETFYIGPSLTPGAVAAQSGTANTFIVPGLQTTDLITIQGVIGTQSSTIMVNEADCFTNGTLTIQFTNVGTGSATPTAGTYVGQVVRLENPLPANAA